MRTPAVLLPPVVLLALLGCDPPLEENFAPFVDVTSPRTLNFEDGTEMTVAYVAGPITLTMAITDRDGDADFAIELFRDETPDDATDEGSLTSIGSATVAGLEPGGVVEFVADEPYVEGEQTLELRVDDGRREGVRTLRLIVEPRTAADPSICWNGGQDCVVDGVLPDSLDALTGSIDDVRADEYYESYWIVSGEQAPTEGDLGPTSTLASTDTARGDLMEFCVRRWLSTNGGERPEVPADAETCTTVEVGNTAPSQPGIVEGHPASLFPGTSPYCVADGATDADGDALTYIYEWTDGTNLLGTGAWLDPLEVVPDANLYCSAAADDGIDVGVSDGAVAVNARPSSQSLGLDIPGDALNFEMVLDVHAQAAPVFDEPQLGTPYVVGMPEASSGDGYLKVFVNNQVEATYRGTGGQAVGRALASGDFDADGHADLVVGANDTLFVFTGHDPGSASGGVPVPASNAPSPLPSTYILEVTLSGLTGYGDVFSAADFGGADPVGLVARVVGAGDPELVKVGRTALVGTGSRAVDPATAGSIVAAAGDTGFGASLATGDYDGDGTADLLVGNPGGAAAQAYLFTNVSGTSSASNAHVRFTGLPAGGGRSVALVDVDGDGADDVLLSTEEGIGVFHASTLPAAGGDVAWTSRSSLLVDAASSTFGSKVYRFPDGSGQFADAVVVEDSGANAVYLFAGTRLGAASVGPLDADYAVTHSSPLFLAGPPLEATGDGYPDLLLVESGGGSSSNTGFLIRSN